MRAGAQRVSAAPAFAAVESYAAGFGEVRRSLGGGGSEPRERSGAWGPRERACKGVRGTKSPGEN